MLERAIGDFNGSGHVFFPFISGAGAFRRMFDGFLSVTADIADDIHGIDNQGRSIERDEHAHPSPESAVSRSFREPRPKEIEQRDPKDMAESQEAGEAREPGQDRYSASTRRSASRPCSISSESR